MQSLGMLIKWCAFARLFARFYLPLIFEDAERLFHIENDAVVTADLSTFLTYSMSVKNAQTGVTSEAAVGLVFDKSIFNKFYMKSNDNMALF